MLVKKRSEGWNTRTKSFVGTGVLGHGGKLGKVKENQQLSHRKTKSSLAVSSADTAVNEIGQRRGNGQRNAVETPEKWHRLLMMLNDQSKREWKGSAVKEKNPVSRMQGRFREESVHDLMETQLDMANKLELAQRANRAYLHVNQRVFQ